MSPDQGATVARILSNYRAAAHLSQRELGRLSGLGFKTISAYETGSRIESLKFSHLVAILGACDVTLGEFASACESAAARLVLTPRELHENRLRILDGEIAALNAEVAR